MPSELNADTHFSVVSNSRTLDLEAPSMEVRDQWVKALSGGRGFWPNKTFKTLGGGGLLVQLCHLVTI